MREPPRGERRIMERKRRILFVAEAVTLAHMARPAVLAAALDPTRYEIHLACDPRYLELFPDLPYTLHRIESVPTTDFMKALARGRPLYDIATLRQYAHSDRRLLDAVAPDLVVGDFRLSLSASAPSTATPYLAISNAYWSPFARQRIPVPELTLTRMTGVRVAQTLFDLARPLAFAYHSRAVNRLRREYDLPSLGPDLRNVYTAADHTLYADIPGLVPMAPLPANHHLLGPVLWSPRVVAPDWWASLPADRAIIYVTMGSSGADRMLERVLAAACDLPVTVIAATAGRTVAGPVPENARLAPFLPGERAAERARVVVCNGGSPTTQQALCAGRPVLGLPSNLDQFLNMQTVESAGAGLLLRPQHADSGKLRRRLIQLLDEPRFTDAADGLRRRCIAHPAGPRFAALIDALG